MSDADADLELLEDPHWLETLGPLLVSLDKEATRLEAEMRARGDLLPDETMAGDKWAMLYAIKMNKGAISAGRQGKRKRRIRILEEMLNGCSTAIYLREREAFKPILAAMKKRRVIA